MGGPAWARVPGSIVAMAIIGAHMLLYSSDVDGLRTQLRDAFGLRSVDAGGGWLIFGLPPAELGVHPAGDADAAGGHHQITFMCDDIRKTAAELREKGVRIEGEPKNEGWGATVMMVLSGNVKVMLYEPR